MSETMSSETVWNKDKTKPKVEFNPEMCFDQEIIQNAIRDHAFVDDKFDLLEKIVLQCPGILSAPLPSGSDNPVITPEIRRMLMQNEEDAKRSWAPPTSTGAIRVEDILTNPGAEPVDPVKTPPDQASGQAKPSTTEGFGGLFNEQEKAFITAMKEFKDKPTPGNAKNVAVQMMTSISRIFYIPDMMASLIVNNGYKEGGKTEVDPDEKGNFMEDFELVRSHLQSYIMLLVSLFAAFNWWYLLFYTSHYVDIKQMLTNPLFTPFIWVIGPIMSPLMSINYWLLGKRLDLPFYESVVKPVMEKKSFWFTLYLLVFTLVYRPISKFYGNSVQKINNNEPNAFYTIVLIAACFNYFYNVVFNKERMFFAQRVFSSIILTFILFLILFIFLMIFAKIAVIMIIAYFAFYSIAPLFFFSGGPWNIFSEIVRMIRDSSDVCVSANIEKNIFVEIKNNLYRYSAIIFMSILVLSVIGKTLDDIPKIHNKSVKTACELLYSIALIAQIIIVIGIISPTAVNSVMNFFRSRNFIGFGEVKTDAPKSSVPISDSTGEIPNSSKSSFIMQIVVAFMRIIELLVMTPFIIIGKSIELTGLGDPMKLVYWGIHFIFSFGGWLDR
jgi:hypothetical protein